MTDIDDLQATIFPICKIGIAAHDLYIPHTARHGNPADEPGSCGSAHIQDSKRASSTDISNRILHRNGCHVPIDATHPRHRHIARLGMSNVFHWWREMDVVQGQQTKQNESQEQGGPGTMKIDTHGYSLL